MVWLVGVLVGSSVGRSLVTALSDIVPGSDRCWKGRKPGRRWFLAEGEMERGNESVKVHQVVSENSKMRNSQIKSK